MVHKTTDRAGLYYWAGPGTIRMIELKFPGARIDYASLLASYDLSVLQKLQEKLSLTDVWVSFSWGFSQKTEAEDYAFIREKLAHFRKLNLRVHAYVQGLNLVVDDNQDHDYYGKDWYGRLLPYHRGRKMTCPNNPYFQKYIAQKIHLALKEDFDGVFVDNVNFGQFPILVAGGWTTFFGCKCIYCQNEFKKQTGLEIPKLFHIGSDVYNAYLAFRKKSITAFVAALSKQVKNKKRLFGTNSFDPKYDTALVYGTDLERLEKLQDYFLFENHDLPRFGAQPRSNSHLKTILKTLQKPTFIVSYKKGVGRESHFAQRDIDAVFTESATLGYNPCYKGTEYTTRGIWHNLYYNKITYPTIRKIPRTSKLKNKRMLGSKFIRLYNRFYNPILTSQFENKYARRALSWLYYRAIH
ncbi:hypothetical protein C4579_02250 [Candidatus Microgenomates bacterium]|nr:MAG: hypothetical protein C4579_02250 [Candidatus Microgenomates bacterium]